MLLILKLPCNMVFRIKYSFLYFLLFSSLALSLDAQSQGINTKNISTVEVDDLSDDQIRRFVEEAEKRGLSEQQLELMARSQGMSSTQISKLRQRINQLGAKGSRNTSYKEINRLRDDQLPSDSSSINLFSSFEEDNEDLDDGPEVFGLDFFNNPYLTFEPSLNIPTPINYVLSAGDEIIIDIWGASEQNYTLSVSPEGAILIPNLGPISLNGLSMEDATKKINSRLKNIYSGLGRNTYSQISLGQIRTIQVNVVGQVKKPGSFSLNSFATAINALYYAQGPTENGTLRDIEVYRGGKKIGAVDIYDFLLGGQQPNFLLQDQDMIVVKPYLERVLIEGEVKRPALYELKKGESIEDLMRYSGGFSTRAFKESLTLRRISRLKRSIITVEEASYGSFELKGGDEILISEITNRFDNRVQIYGAVHREGEFQLKEKMTLKDLIVIAEGLREDAFMGRGIIVRLSEDLSFENLSFNLNEVLSQSREPIYLQNGDYVNIQSIFDLRESQFVTVQGEIIKEGDYPFVDNMTVEDLIFLSGGFKESAAKSFVEVARRLDPSKADNSSLKSNIFTFPISRDLSLSPEASDFKLSAFDLVLIRRSPNYFEQEIVEVEGEVNFPGKYSIGNKNERISDLLKRAGGTTNFAYIKGATLIRRTEYYEESDSKAAAQRRENLKNLAERDSLLEKRAIKIKPQESIGIRLTEILNKPGSKYDLIIKEGDVLSIPRELETVRIRGELLYPSTARFDKSYNFRDYISLSGGFGDRARKGKSYVLYANGAAARTSSFLWFKNYPKIEPGAEIIVPQGPEKRKISATEVLAIGNVAVTMGWVFVQLFQTIGSKN